MISGRIDLGGMKTLVMFTMNEVFTGDSRTIDTSYAFSVVEVGPLLISVPKLISFALALLLAAAMWAFMTLTDLGRAATFYDCLVEVAKV